MNRKLAGRLRREEGVALVAVLGFLVIISILALSAVTTSQISNFTSVTFYDRSKASYAAEGAVSRMSWIIMADKSKYTNRGLGETDYGDEEHPHFLADGFVHRINYYGTEVNVTVLDMASGFDISDDMPSRKLFEAYRSMYKDEPAMMDEFNAFLGCLDDYVDANETLRLKGMERMQYDEMGLYPLPRNGRLQFREEVMWIPGFGKFFGADDQGRLSSFRIIPPQNMPRIQFQGDNFFSASRESVMSKCSFSSGQTDKVMAAREKWFISGTSMKDDLDPTVWATLKSHFSFNESGFYTITAEASAGPGRAKRIYSASARILTQMIPPGLQYYEVSLY